MPDQPVTPLPNNPQPDQSPLSTAQSNSTLNPSPQPTTAATKDPLLTDKTLPEDLDARWRSLKCQVCGYVYEGEKELIQCPRCGNTDPDKFD